MKSLRETAKEIAEKIVYQLEEYSPDRIDTMKIITEALEAAYKQGALARVTGPSIEEIAKHCNREFEFGSCDWDNAYFGAKWYRDNLKITPLTAEDILELLPSDIELSEEYSKKGCVRHWLRDFVAAKLEGK